MGLYNKRTDIERERNGVRVEYSEYGIAVTLARISPNNTEMKATLERLSRPIRHALSVGMVSDERSAAMLKEAFSIAIIKQWEIQREKDGKPVWLVGVMDDPDKPDDLTATVPFNPENVMRVLNDPALHDLWRDFQQVANSPAEFRMVRSDDVKN